MLLGAFDRRAHEFAQALAMLERGHPRDAALVKACEAFAIEREDAEELLERAAELGLKRL